VAGLADVRAIALGLPRTSEHLIREHVKFRVGRLVYASVSPDEELLVDAWCMVVPKKVAASYLEG
jgi:hypothetical protein